MFAKVTPLSLFVTPVFAQEVPAADRAALDRGLLAELATLPGGAATGPSPWRSHHDLHQRPGFAALTGLLLETASRVLAKLRSEQQAPAITALWATREAPGAQLPPALFQNAYLGGLYLAESGGGAAIPAGQDQVRALDPRPQAHLITAPTTEPTALTLPEATLPLRPGRLLLFPAWLWHATLPNPGPGQRTLFHCAISFQDFAAAMSPPRWTGMTAPETGAAP